MVFVRFGPKFVSCKLLLGRQVQLLFRMQLSGTLLDHVCSLERRRKIHLIALHALNIVLRSVRITLAKVRPGYF